MIKSVTVQSVVHLQYLPLSYVEFYSILELKVTDGRFYLLREKQSQVCLTTFPQRT